MSGERVPYHLRTNKFVERALLVELLSHLNAVNPIAEYLYVGFGGPYLEDFKILHQQFGMKHMLSLEIDEWVFRRQKFNLPYSCITCSHQSSSDFITNFDEVIRPFGKNRRVLIWLDYAAADALRTQLEEIRALTARLQPYDLLKITLNANPTTLGQGGDHSARLAELRDRIGDLIPEGVTEADMVRAEYPKVLLKTVELVIKTASNETSDLMFQPLANYVYADTHQMLTVTGIVLPRGTHTAFLREARLKSMEEVITTNWRGFHRIDVPYLSLREKLLLDGALSTRKKNKEPALSVRKKLMLAATPDQTLKLIRSYAQFYRFYPHYHRVHY
jgi:hypothetical protein